MLMMVSYLCCSVLPAGLINVLGTCAAVGLTALPLFWFYSLNAEERSYFVGLMRAVGRRFRR